MDKGTMNDWIEDLQQQANSLHAENRRLEQRIADLIGEQVLLEHDRDQWKSVAEGFANLAGNSAGLASKLFEQMDELLNEETGRD